LRDVVEFHRKAEEARGLRKTDPGRHQELRDELDQIRTRLIESGFAQQSKSEKQSGIVTEVGPAVAAAVLDFFASPEGVKTLRRIKDLGIIPKAEMISAKEAAGLPLAGKTFVLTGTLPSMTREEASGQIEARGGHVTGAVSKKTDYLLAGAEAGSKLEKAKKLGVPIIDEAGFRELLTN